MSGTKASCTFRPSTPDTDSYSHKEKKSQPRHSADREKRAPTDTECYTVGIKRIEHMRTSPSFGITSLCLMVFVAYGLSFSEENKSTDYYSDPQAIIDHVSSRGAREVVQELYRDKEIWYALLHNIATGRKLWLEAAVALRSGSDAGASEMLALAVGEALEHAPENVLRVDLKVFWLKSVCCGPDVDDPRYDSFELSMSAINLRMKRVAAITDPELQHLRDQCIRYLEESIKGIASFYGVNTQ